MSYQERDFLHMSLMEALYIVILNSGDESEKEISIAKEIISGATLEDFKKTMEVYEEIEKEEKLQISKLTSQITKYENLIIENKEAIETLMRRDNPAFKAKLELIIQLKEASIKQTETE